MIESEVFRKQMYCIVESACDIVGLFDPPRSDFGLHSDSAPGSLFPHAPPVVTPLQHTHKSQRASDASDDQVHV